MTKPSPAVPLTEPLDRHGTPGAIRPINAPIVDRGILVSAT